MKLLHLWAASSTLCVPIAGATLFNSDFQVDIDDVTGALVGLRDAQAGESSMNWIGSPTDTPWLPPGSRWGLGFADLGPDFLHRFYWRDPQTSANNSRVDHAVSYTAGSLRLDVDRYLSEEDGSFTERYTFVNKGNESLNLTETKSHAIAIYTPFNDHYTNTSDSIHSRAHSHVWANGGANAWVKMDQMGGFDRNLGLVLTKGSLAGYSIESRDIITMSNTRGVFLLHPIIPTLQPGESALLEWTFFWHSDWDDFFEQCAERSNQFIRFDIPTHTLTQGQNVTIKMTGAVNEKTRVNGGPVSCSKDACQYTMSAGSNGQKDIRISTPTKRGLQNSTIFLNTVPDLDDLVSSRVNFIIQNQQVRGNRENPNFGGYAVYDTQAESIAFWDKSSDRTTGRERVGMGIFISRYLASHPNATAVRSSLQTYYEFVSLKLQGEDGEVYDRPKGAGTSTERLYNWPWVIQFHLAIAKLGLELSGPVADKSPLERFMMTLENFYETGGKELYAIGLPIFESLQFLRESGHDRYYNRVLELFLSHGEVILARGLDYPPFEVNFEQSIVAPAAVMMVELYRATGNQTWLQAGKTQLDTLLRFQGKQPDYRMNSIAIRHWDGYWFGKDRHWGDTFPHYWSTIDSIALYHYAKATGDEAYRKHADEIIRNNLVLFSPDGTAGCAWIYPLTVNGRETHYRDPYANDQDWALNHLLYIQMMDLESSS